MRTIGTPSTQARKLNAIASGALPNGEPVVVNADGTVSVVSGSDTSAGTPVVFDGPIIDSSAVFDSNSNKVVVAYRDSGNSNYGTAIVGTVSGTSISFGAAVVFRSNTTQYPSATFDSNSNKVVIAYQDVGNSFKGTAIVGTVSGTSISFGTPALFVNNSAVYMSLAFDSSSNKVIIAYADDNGTEYGTAIVGTVSGTSISFGTSVVFESAVTYSISCAYDVASEKVVIAYWDAGNSDYGTAVVGTVSGTSISFGSPVVFESAYTEQISITYDSVNEKVVIAYRDNGNSSYGTAIVGTVSGTSISFGSSVVFESANVSWISSTYDSNAQKVVITYDDNGNSSKGTAIAGIVSGTSISFESAIVFEEGNTVRTSATFDSNSNKVVVSYGDDGNSGNGTAAVIQVGSTNLTSENYIGLSSNGYPDTAGATIDVQGAINDRQSNLTAGQSYYVQTDGTLTTTAGDPSVFAGTAISATKMIVKG